MADLTPIREVIAEMETLSEEERAERARRFREETAARAAQSQPRPRIAPPRIPKRFVGKTLAGYRPRNESQAAALEATRRFIRDASRGRGPMLALIGETNTGKSHLLYAAAQELFTQGHHAYCRPWYKLGDDLRYGSRDQIEDGAGGKTWAFREAWEVRQDLWSRRIIMLDEVRQTSGTNFDDTELTKLACWAYDEELAVFITTNTNPLDGVLGVPAARRFAQVVIDAPALAAALKEGS